MALRVWENNGIENESAPTPAVFVQIINKTYPVKKWKSLEKLEIREWLGKMR